jgi:hypothetical protein
VGDWVDQEEDSAPSFDFRLRSLDRWLSVVAKVGLAAQPPEALGFLSSVKNSCA